MILRGILLGLASALLASCANQNPGPLAGTWMATEPFPVTVTFRDGETEAMGVTRAASYEVHGNEVLVTYAEGSNKGTTFKYQVINPNTIRSDSATFRRVH